MFRWGNYHGLIRWGQWYHKGPNKKEAGWSELEKDVTKEAEKERNLKMSYHWLWKKKKKEKPTNDMRTYTRDSL